MTDDDGTDASTVARQYRQLLRWYPARWRRANEAVVLGMLLDDARGRGLRVPTRRDRLSLVTGGLRERFLAFERTPAVNRVTLSLGAAFSLYYVFFVTWAPGAHLEGAVGPFSNPAVITGALLCLAWLLAMLQAGGSSRAVSWCAFGAAIATAYGAAHWRWLGPSAEAATVFAALALVSAIRVRRPSRNTS